MIRRWIVGVLTLLLAGSVISWIFYIPPWALQPLKPVPAHAQLVYQSDTPGRFLSFFPNLGKKADKMSNMLEESPLTVAAVPLRGRDRGDTWVAVSVLGPRALRLHWQLRLFPPPGIKPIRSYGAWPVWQYIDPALPAWARIRFSIAEGLLICSISQDSHDITYLLDTLDGRRPSAE